MTEQLKQAFAKASELEPEEQDQFAAWILAELESEERWQNLFAESEEALAKLAQKAREEHAAGLTLPLDPDEL